MSTIIYPSPIFGPVHSRRLGISLGINLLPGDGKVCSFDCIYCECGFNADHRPKQKLPTREEVAGALEAKLKEMAAEGIRPDVLTFAGNGEPTCHPQYPEIIDDTIRLRDELCPEAKVSVLSNATFILREDVRKALGRVNNNILKLDTVSEDFIRLVDRPTGAYDVRAIIEAMKLFKGQCIIQTMFLKGEYRMEAEGVSTENNARNKTVSVDNTGESFVNPWLDAVREIAPREVMIYTIDRETPAEGLQKASPAELNAIRDRVIEMGIPCKASY